MSYESKNSSVMDELDGPLREAVEAQCLRRVPHARMTTCLERIVTDLPFDTQTDDRRSMLDKSGVASSHRVHRRWWVGATAAIAALVAIVLNQFGSTSADLVDVAQAVGKQPWIHVTQRMVEGGAVSRESETWYSPVREVSATRREEWTAYHDHKLKVYYSYDSVEGVLYRVPEIGTGRKQSPLADIAEALPGLLADYSAPDDPLSKMEFLREWRDDLTLVAQQVDYSSDNGRESLDYSLTLNLHGEQHPIQVLFQIDPDTRLPRLGTVTGQHEGRLHRFEATFDYPRMGPQDIYAIGVPRDAQLVDRVPSGEVARVIAGVEAGRVRFDDFRAVVISYRDGSASWWRERPQLVHRKGNRLRRDLGFESRAEAVEPPEAVDAAQWWRTRASDFRYRPTRICIDGTDHVFENPPHADSDHNGSVRTIESDLPWGQWIPAFWSLTPDYVARPPLGVPNQHMEAIVQPGRTGGPEGTILLQVRRSGRVDSAPDPNAGRHPVPPVMYQFWVDPGKEYLVMRMDMMISGDRIDSSYIVESLAQSPQGHWYPTRVRHTSSRPETEDEILEYHVEFGVEIPEQLFDLKQPLSIEQMMLTTK